MYESCKKHVKLIRKTARILFLEKNLAKEKYLLIYENFAKCELQKFFHIVKNYAKKVLNFSLGNLKNFGERISKFAKVFNFEIKVLKQQFFHQNFKKIVKP